MSKYNPQRWWKAPICWIKGHRWRPFRRPGQNLETCIRCGAVNKL